MVIVSATGKTTNKLIEAGNAAEAGNLGDALAILGQIGETHRGLARQPQTVRKLEQLMHDAGNLLGGIFQLREQTPRSQALLVSFGERLSATLFCDYLAACDAEADMLDARRVIVTDDNFAEATVDFEKTTERFAREPLLQSTATIPVITGFIAATEDGATTTLGRSGSDYTAALIAQLVKADELVIYTDVDGILTADPALVHEARTLSSVSYREAAEMSYFGAQVVHPRTMLPALKANIPIWIKHSGYPERPGTCISERSDDSPAGVKTVTSVRDLSLVTIDGRGMAGLVGVARRIFESAEGAAANVIMISQSSSEQTVSVVVNTASAGGLVRELKRRFALELKTRAIESIDQTNGVSIVSIIGAGMAGRPGTAASFFSSLASVGVNILAIAQGASELSISVAIRQDQLPRAVRAAHTAFGLTRLTNLVVIGSGRVGETFLRMLEQNSANLSKNLNLDLRVVGVCNSQKFVFAANGMPPTAAIGRLKEGQQRPDDHALLDQIGAEHFTDVVVVDMTAAETGGLHAEALRRGFHVVTANKKPLAGSMSAYRKLMDASYHGRARYGYETTFGAGLPALHTLHELLLSGDTLLSVTGCLSGTLGYICTLLEEGQSLQVAVERAVEQGYTEPDPREDLSGRDVARKALIIARSAGRLLEPQDVQLEPLVPNLEGGLAPALAAYQDALAARIAAAADAGRTLRYTASIDQEGVRVGLSEVPKDGPIGALRGPDNILVFRTQRYDQYPLVVRGPGAGAEVTAAGVLADVLKVTHELGRAIRPQSSGE